MGMTVPPGPVRRDPPGGREPHVDGVGVRGTSRSPRPATARLNASATARPPRPRVLNRGLRTVRPLRRGGITVRREPHRLLNVPPVTVPLVVLDLVLEERVTFLV